MYHFCEFDTGCSFASRKRFEKMVVILGHRCIIVKLVSLVFIRIPTILMSMLSLVNVDLCTFPFLFRPHVSMSIVSNKT